MAYSLREMMKCIETFFSQNGYSDWSAGNEWLDEPRYGPSRNFVVFTSTNQRKNTLSFRRMCVLGSYWDTQRKIWPGTIYLFDTNDDNMYEPINSMEELLAVRTRWEEPKPITNQDELNQYLKSKFPNKFFGARGNTTASPFTDNPLSVETALHRLISICEKLADQGKLERGSIQ
jgi:hypothetical protein